MALNFFAMVMLRRYLKILWLSIFCLFLFILSFSPYAFSQSRDDLVTLALMKRVAVSDPMSCAKTVQDVQHTTACLGDAGSFQLARLGLAVESLASALSFSGIKGSHEQIQRVLFSDVLKHGPVAALTAPAMNLVDSASSTRSPFGSASSQVAGMSIVALEYLYPGIIPQMRISYENVAAVSKLDVSSGPRSYSDYAVGPELSPMRMDDYRVFDVSGGSQPILNKLALNTRMKDGFQNMAADFFISENSTHAFAGTVPVAQVFGEIAAFSAQSGIPIYGDRPPANSQPEATPGNLQSNSPFQGVACFTCSQAGKEMMGGSKQSGPLIGSQPGIFEFSKLFSKGLEVSKASRTKSGPIDGLGIVAATRTARLSQMTDAVSRQNSESPNTSADQNPERIVSSEAGTFIEYTAKKVAKKAAAVAIGAYISGKVGELIIKSGGGKVGFAMGLILIPIKSGCDFGEGGSQCDKSAEQVKKEKKDIQHKLEEQAKKNKKVVKPKEEVSPTGGSGDAHSGGKKPGGKPTASTTRSATFAEPNAFHPAPDDGPGPGGLDLPPEASCGNVLSKDCGCAINEAGEVGYCVPTGYKDLLFKYASHRSQGWYMMNDGVDRRRNVYVLTDKVLNGVTAVRPSDTDEIRLQWTRLSGDPPPNGQRTNPGRGQRQLPDLSIDNQWQANWTRNLFPEGLSVSPRFNPN